MNKMVPELRIENLEVWILVWAFIYIHTLCMQAVKALASLHICADLPKPLLLVDMISTKIWCTGPNFEYCMWNI